MLFEVCTSLINVVISTNYVRTYLVPYTTSITLIWKQHKDSLKSMTISKGSRYQRWLKFVPKDDSNDQIKDLQDLKLEWINLFEEERNIIRRIKFIHTLNTNQNKVLYRRRIEFEFTCEKERYTSNYIHIAKNLLPNFSEKKITYSTRLWNIQILFLKVKNKNTHKLKKKKYV